MLRNYLKIALRNLLKHQGYSFINIFGLAIGMGVAMLIGLWIHDELSYNKYHPNYDRIAQVMQHNEYNGKKETQYSNPAVMGAEIRRLHGGDFTYVVQSSWTEAHILGVGDKRLVKRGNHFEPEITDLLGLKMLGGTRSGLKDPYSILLSQSVAETFFGKEDPLGKTMRLDNRYDLKVTGVYEDLPQNTSLREVTYMLSWKLLLVSNPWIEQMKDPWGSNFTQTYVQVAENADMEKVSG
jgi:ABC-type antimicrobial peptide transport system permease subunit